MKELNILGSTILYFTRLPLPFQVPYDKSYMAKTLTWFSFIGLLVGFVGAGVWWISSELLPNSISIGLSMVSTILLTGAFHEDGFADICDGFGGGYTKEKILVIMKDSCIGAYGAIGMVLMLLMKFITLSEIAPSNLFVAIILGHALSRASVLVISERWDYARMDDSSKSRSTSQRLGWKRILWSACLGLLPLLYFPFGVIWLAPILAIITAYLMGMYYNKQIGGYTGDCLGATQQVVEVIVYIVVVMGNPIYSLFN